ncbi:MAG: sigma 54-interacting transcriptional regulator [Aquificaceae bacterium]|nr:sigma 54-interacting transcriptional regulator [Aquificaceae bacterium]MDW8237171.1 sigma 54-interacting transcriptional regulator [Aquificaceae bacterium]
MDFFAFESLFDGVLVISKDRKVIYANRSAKRLLPSLKEGDFCRGLFSICKSCPLDLVLEELQGVQVYDVSCSGGAHACWSMSPAGEFVIEFFRDVSPVVSCVIEAERQRRYKEAILNSIVEAILVLDEKGFVVEHNLVASRMLCVEDNQELKGKHIKELIGIEVEALPPEGERAEILVNTPCGKQKASLLISPMGELGLIISIHVAIEDEQKAPEEGLFFGSSKHFQSIVELVSVISQYDVSVLIEGETGSGKSVLAKVIHSMSPRKNGPFIKVNCGAIPEGLLEAELFGYVRGAFTGAIKDKPGKAELAEGGTLLLDEIGDMPLSLQTKILHLVQEKEIERLGDTKTRKVNVRIIASTNKNLKELVKKGQFRDDLYYRLSVVKLNIPPLRERKDDIPALAGFFLKKFSKKYSKKLKGFSPKALKALIEHPFPGNIRELENIVERAVITAQSGLISAENLGLEVEDSCQVSERIKIEQALRQAGGNKAKAAQLLGMHRTTLWRKLKELGL